MLDLILRLRRPISVVIHAGLIVLANLSAVSLRFDGDIPPSYWNLALRMLPWLLAVRIAAFLPFRLFEGLWKYTSLWDIRNIVLGVTVSTAAFYAVNVLLAPEPSYPRSLYLVDSLLLICLLSGVRMSRRIYREFGRPSRGRKLLIYGAGDAGEMLARDMRQNGGFDAEPVGFIDDDEHKSGERIHGLAVLGTRKQLGEVLRRTQAEEVLIAIPSASPQALRAIVRELEPFKVRITTLPRLADLISKRVGVGQIRQLKVEDLLARDPVSLDIAAVRQVLSGKRVLVTGAGGSIGSELCRQIAGTQPELLLMLDRYENSLFTVNNEIADMSAAPKTRCLIGDITDERRINQVLTTFKPNVIFHAAAHKHVPLMEDNVSEAIKNNVRGTRIVAEAAQRAGVERFVLISTDKAVNPTSVMGAAKRVAELLVKSLDQASQTRFMVVRFGNVLGSNGSVVPRFLSQIAAGGPVTVTHPDMRRYFMLIPEAVQLVLHAAAINDRGSIFVLDMGEQLKVADMARDIIRLSGFVPDHEIEIVYTGIRPGEKLLEELIGDGEMPEVSPVPKIMMVRPNASSSLASGDAIAHLEQFALDGSDEDVIEQLRRIVPSFAPLPRNRSALRA